MRTNPALAGPPAPATLLGRKTESPADLELRRLEKKKAKRRLVFRTIGWTVFGVALVGALIWVALFSSVFALQSSQVTVTGPEGTDVAKAQAQVEAEVGRSLLLISEGSVRERLLTDPAIQEVTITKEWPDGLRVELAPRVPVAAVAGAEGFQLVGADGVVVSETPDPPEGMLVLQSDVPVNEKILGEVVQVRSALPEHLNADVATVRYEGGLFTLVLSGGSEVLWGNAEDLELKSQVLTLLVEQRPSAFYDVADPERPSIR